MHTGPQNPSEVGRKDVKFIDAKKKKELLIPDSC